MTIDQKREGEKLSLIIDGRLDTTTAPQLEVVVRTALEGVNELIINLSKLEYISSAGLRVLLSAQKTMNKQGEMVITGVTDTVMEVFDVTGFTDILNIQ